MLNLFRRYCTRAALILVASLMFAAKCGDANLTVSPGHAFFESPVGDSKTVTFTVTNSGTEAAMLGPITQQGLELLEPFSVAGGTCATGGTVAGNGGTCTLVLAFSPLVSGVHNGRFVVTYNWEGSGVDVRGAVGALEANALGLIAPQVFFPEMAVGQRRIETATLTNPSRFAARIEGIAPPYLPHVGFRLVGGTCARGFVLPARGGTCTVLVEYVPLVVGPLDAYSGFTYRWVGPETMDGGFVLFLSHRGFDP
ncbi:MAG TPA: choice-of-anchor D domain-containing protein [Polyangiaceae bacterium]|nr:choice-of-anchor D domain-containing protein [Polyangiaceae bacterium]